MGILSLVRLISKLVKGGDLIAFIVSTGAGYILATVLPAGPWTIYVFMLTSYHLFLTWLVIDSDRRKGFSMPIPVAILTHAACLTLILSIAFGRQNIPFFAFVRIGVIAIAFFERDLIFKGNAKTSESATKKKSRKPVSDTAAVNLVSVEVALEEATLEDHDAWLRHLSQPNRPHKRAGLSVKEEYEQWLVARVSARQATPPSQPPA